MSYLRLEDPPKKRKSYPTWRNTPVMVKYRNALSKKAFALKILQQNGEYF